MTILGETATAPFKVGIRDRLRIAREDAYPTMDKVDFSKNVLRMGKNIATAYESKTGTGTREENMKDMVLQTWADKCGVSFDALKYGRDVIHTGPDGGITGAYHQGSRKSHNWADNVTAMRNTVQATRKVA